ncbi:MAG: HEPN domain-containing protein [Leptospiraceae bacterium]|nr:HEPN domain-containing protein [Leptospiraceae bacterium]MCP5496469.1 HEPN domain-containing protein [Leptospiraceae bacterium]
MIQNEQEIIALLEKAYQSIKAAEILLKTNHPSFSASRSYYTMFYIAEALLLSKNLSFSKHSAVIANFGKEFIKTGVIESKFHRYLIDAFEIRSIGDYEFMQVVDNDIANEVLLHSVELFNEVKKFFNCITQENWTE